jgi:hypothetical protein
MLRRLSQREGSGGQPVQSLTIPNMGAFAQRQESTRKLSGSNGFILHR